MIEIRFHGRGGQGSVVGAQLLAEAAFCEGKHVQAFPYFGVERRGAPVTAYTRISSTPIRMRTNIYNPNHVVVMDPTLIDVVDVTEGLKDDGWLIVNTIKHPSELEIKHPHIGTVDATHIARKHGLGSKNAPIVNTAILGAVVRATSVVAIEDLLKSIRYKAPAKAEENAKAAQEAYDSLKAGE
ncbi:MAG: 2-oxoacid:acceptor oxidoreductase family protein [Candidatus Methanofastidiosia archaeon]